jgi:hypothetical protein
MPKLVHHDRDTPKDTSWLVGYVLSSMDNVPSADRTKYGEAYLETVNGRSSIM